jgi:NAD(P) transhydrogenase subunit alpha
MYARNLFNFLSPFIKEGTLALDWEDEVIAGTCLTHAGVLGNCQSSCRLKF